ncbi:MAG: glycosyltransferase, partial [Thermodesulfobacteriota bacterium]
MSYIVGEFFNALGYVSTFDLEKLLRVYWFFFLFDFPRYVLTDIGIFFYELFKRFRRNNQEQLFLLELRERPPLVSVVIAALNEEDTIEGTLLSLKEQTYTNLQIIIVDDGSTDKTPEICNRMKKWMDYSFIRLEERSGKSAALNYGSRMAKGKYVVFADSDTTFDRDAVFKLIKGFFDSSVGAISGNVRPRNGRKNLLTGLQNIEYNFTITIARRIRAKFGILPIISGAFGVFRKELLKPIGMHEPGPGNDSDLTIRIRKLGYKIAFAPDAIALTNVPENMHNLILQRWRWDRNLIKTRFKKHRDVYDFSSKNFRIRDSLSFIDSLFFHVVLAFVSLIYLIDISINFPHILLFILMVNYILYFISELIEFLIVLALSERKWDDFSYIIYLPLFNPYKL